MGVGIGRASGWRLQHRLALVVLVLVVAAACGLVPGIVRPQPASAMTTAHWLLQSDWSAIEAGTAWDMDSDGTYLWLGPDNDLYNTNSVWRFDGTSWEGWGCPAGYGGLHVSSLASDGSYVYAVFGDYPTYDPVVWRTPTTSISWAQYGDAPWVGATNANLDDIEIYDGTPVVHEGLYGSVYRYGGGTWANIRSGASYGLWTGASGDLYVDAANVERYSGSGTTWTSLGDPGTIYGYTQTEIGGVPYVMDGVSVTVKYWAGGTSWTSIGIPVGMTSSDLKFLFYDGANLHIGGATYGQVWVYSGAGTTWTREGFYDDAKQASRAYFPCLYDGQLYLAEYNQGCGGWLQVAMSSTTANSRAHLTGSGTVGDPYVITDVYGLQEMEYDLTAYYELGGDIDASATATWGGPDCGGTYGFAPIGSEIIYIAPTSDYAESGTWTTVPASPTTKWDKVDSPYPAVDDLNSYIQSTVGGSQVTFGKSVALPADMQVDRVQVITRSREVTSSTTAQRCVLTIGGVDYYPSSPTSLNATTSFAWQAWQYYGANAYTGSTIYVDPSTGLNWTGASVNAIQGFGVELVTEGAGVRWTNVTLAVWPTFSGHFDGNGYAIDALQVDDPYPTRATEPVGMIAVARAATISNVEFTAPLLVSTASDHTVGVLAGRSDWSAISGVDVTDGDVQGVSMVGGVVGATAGGSIADCVVRGTDVYSSTDAVGGAVGRDLSVWGFWDGEPAPTVMDNLTVGGTVEVLSGNEIGGLVGRSDWVQISNCDVTASVTADSNDAYYVGGIVGYFFDGTMAGCSYNGTITVTTLSGAVGGLLGLAGDYAYGYEAMRVSDSHSSGTITGGNRDIGGAVGATQWGAEDGYSEISNCWSDMDITAAGAWAIGGFIGEQGAFGYNDTDKYHRIVECWSSGDVSGFEWFGGFAGQVLTGTITNCFSRSNGTAESGSNGGFVAWLSAGTITNCYSTGTADSSGGFCYTAEAGATVTGCFWDTVTSGAGSSDGGTGRTTAQMLQQSTYDGAAWDFDTVWCWEASDGNDAYPILQDTLYPGWACGAPPSTFVAMYQTWGYVPSTFPLWYQAWPSFLKLAYIGIVLTSAVLAYRYEPKKEYPPDMPEPPDMPMS